MSQHVPPAAASPLSERVQAERVELPEARAGLVWRAATPGDVPAIHALRRESGLLDHPHYVVTREEIEQDFARDELDLGLDSVLAHDPSGAVVAYGLTILLPSQETLVRSLFDGAVHPARRGEGIGGQLLDWHEARGRQQLASSSKLLPGWLLAYADERASGALRLFERHGFEFKRWWFELARPLAAPIDDVPLDPALRLVPYTSEWSEPAREARNDVFRDHWGSQPTPKAAWDATARLPISRPDLSFVAVDPATDEVVAFVLTSVNEDEWEQTGYSFAYIEYVGVRRSWRGRKVAQALLAHALGVFRDAGFERAVLDVDAESPTGALGLYEHVGFERVNRSVSFVKEF